MGVGKTIIANAFGHAVRRQNKSAIDRWIWGNSCHAPIGSPTSRWWCACPESPARWCTISGA